MVDRQRLRICHLKLSSLLKRTKKKHKPLNTDRGKVPLHMDRSPRRCVEKFPTAFWPVATAYVLFLHSPPFPPHIPTNKHNNPFAKKRHAGIGTCLPGRVVHVTIPRFANVCGILSLSIELPHYLPFPSGRASTVFVHSFFGADVCLTLGMFTGSAFDLLWNTS